MRASGELSRIAQRPRAPARPGGPEDAAGRSEQPRRRAAAFPDSDGRASPQRPRGPQGDAGRSEAAREAREPAAAARAAGRCGPSPSGHGGAPQLSPIAEAARARSGPEGRRAMRAGARQRGRPRARSGREGRRAMRPSPSGHGGANQLNPIAEAARARSGPEGRRAMRAGARQRGRPRARSGGPQGERPSPSGHGGANQLSPIGASANTRERARRREGQTSDCLRYRKAKSAASAASDPSAGSGASSKADPAAAIGADGPGAALPASPGPPQWGDAMSASNRPRAQLKTGQAPKAVPRAAQRAGAAEPARPAPPRPPNGRGLGGAGSRRGSAVGDTEAADLRSAARTGGGRIGSAGQATAQNPERRRRPLPQP